MSDSVLYSEVSVARAASTSDADSTSACDDNILYATLDFAIKDGGSVDDSIPGDIAGDTGTHVAKVDIEASHSAASPIVEFDRSVNPKASPWYHGTISAETVAMLLNDKEEGTFLVRQESDMLFELVMVEDGGIVGRQISRREKRYRFDTGRERGLASKTLAGLIDQVRVPNPRWATPLLAFVPRHLATEERVLQEMEHAATVMHTAESSIRVHSGEAGSSIADMLDGPPVVQPFAMSVRHSYVERTTEARPMHAHSSDADGTDTPKVPTTEKPVLASRSAEDFDDNNPKHKHKYENLPRYYDDAGHVVNKKQPQPTATKKRETNAPTSSKPLSRTASRTSSPVGTPPERVPSSPGPALPVRQKSSSNMERSVYLPAEAVLDTPPKVAPAVAPKKGLGAARKPVEAPIKTSPAPKPASRVNAAAVDGDNMFATDPTRRRPWYAGEVDRDYCDQYVVQRASQGDFLVRESTSSTNMVLVVHDDGKVINFPIAYRRGKVGLGMVEMDTIDDLIEAMKLIPLTSPITHQAVMLRNPIDIHGTASASGGGDDEGSGSDDGYIHVEEVTGAEPRNAYVMLRTPEMVEAEKKKRAADARKRNFLGGVFGRKKGAGKPSPVPLSAAEETSTHVEINKAQQFSQATQATGEDYDGRRARRERLQTVSTGAPSAARVPRGAAANAHVASTNRFTRTQSMSAQRTSRNPDVAKNQAGDLAVAAPSKQRFARMKEVLKQTEAVWLRPQASRGECDRYLQALPTGAFVVRKSSSQAGCWVLSLKADHSDIWNGLVRENSRGFMIKGMEVLYVSLVVLLARLMTEEDMRRAIGVPLAPVAPAAVEASTSGGRAGDEFKGLRGALSVLDDSDEEA